MLDVQKIARQARQSAHPLSLVGAAVKKRALIAMAEALVKGADKIIGENKKDLDAARRAGLASALIARLTLDKSKIKKIADGIRQIAFLPDPVGSVMGSWKRPNGLKISKVRVPIGVILIIYESRPNVTADCMALCLKSGNSVILKGGSEAIHSNRAIFKVLERAAYEHSIPPGVFQFVDTTDRGAVQALLKLSEFIDLVIPRGGESLIRRVAEESRIPVIKHYKGVCHVYVDRKARFDKAVSIALNAKVQNPGVCNAMETLLVHEAIAKSFVPTVCRALAAQGVEIRGDERVRRFYKDAVAATEEDWSAEYLDLVLAVRVVRDVEEAIGHVERYGSHHSDAIVTEDKKAAEKFAASVDSACVFVNASTRFNDGGEFGMGAEMGISTDKLHARGPMGLEELTSYKYIIRGSGQVRR